MCRIPIIIPPPILQSDPVLIHESQQGRSHGGPRDRLRSLGYQLQGAAGSVLEQP